MARFLRRKFMPDTTGTTITGALPSHKSGDLILAAFRTRQNCTFSESTAFGWSVVYHENTSNGTTGVLGFFCTSSSESTPTFAQSGASDMLIGQYAVFDGVYNSGTFADSFPHKASSIHTNDLGSLDSVTTTNADSLLFGIVGTSSFANTIHFTSESRQISMQQDANDNSMATCVYGKQGTGATDTPSFTLVSSATHTDVVIEIRDDGTGLDGMSDPSSDPCELVHPAWASNADGNFGGFQGSAYQGAGTSVDVTGIFTANLDGVAPQSAVFITNGAISLTDWAQPLRKHNCLYYTGSSQWNKPTLQAAEFASDHPMFNSTGIDVSNSLISIRIQNPYQNGVDYDSGGILVGFTSGNVTTTGKGSIWKVESFDSKLRADIANAPFVFDTSRTAYHTSDNGACELANAEHLLLGFTTNATNRLPRFGLVHKLNTIPLLAGNATNPCSLEAAYTIASACGALSVQKQQGQASGQYYANQSMQVGNGSTSTPVTYDDSGKSLEYPAAYSESARFVHCNVASAYFSYTIYLSADCSYTAGAGVYDFGDYHNFTIHASTSTSASYDFSGRVIKNATVTLQDLGADKYTNLTFDGCKEINHNSADLTGVGNAGCTISNSTDTCAIRITGATQSALQTALDNLLYLSLLGNTVAIRVDFTGTGDVSLNFTGITWSGNTTDIHYDSTNASALTAVCDAGSGASATSISGSATGVTISAPVPTLTVTSNVSADIKIFTTGTQTIVSQATGTSDTYTTLGTYDITVMQAGYLPQRVTGVTLGTSDVDQDFTLVEDPVYNASHGLTWTTDYSYNATTRVMTIVANQQGRDLYSALIDDFIAQSALDNRPFPIVAVGPDRFEFTSDGATAATIDSGDVQFWKGAGMTWEHATTGNDTHRYCAIKSVGAIGGTNKVRYVQEEGGTINSVTLVSGVIDQVIQYYSDTNGDGTPDYNYEGHLVFKVFAVDYYTARNNVLDSFGISALEPYEYIISLSNTATGLTSGDQSLTISVTNQQATPVEEQTGYTYSFKVTEAGLAGPEALLAQWLYDTYTDPTAANLYGSSLRAFDLPCPIVESGGSYSSIFQYVENTETTTEHHGFYFEESSSYHPDFLRQQEDEDSGSGFFVTPVLASVSITGMPNAAAGNNRLQISNETAKSASTWATGQAVTAGDIMLRSTGVGSENTAGLYLRAENSGTTHATVEPLWNTTPGGTTTDNDITWTTYKVLFYDADPAATSYSTTYTDGDEFKSGETYRIRFAELDGSTSFKTYETTGIVSASGFSVAATMTVDAVYASNAVDGSSLDATFSPNYTSSYIVMDTNTDFSGIGAYAYFCYTLTQTDGMNLFWGGVTALDTGNYRINNDILNLYFDETTGFVKQTDSVRIFRADGARPALDPTTGTNGIEMNWRTPVSVVEVNTGSAVNQATVQAALTAQGYTAARSSNLDNADSLFSDMATEISEIHQDQGLDSANPVTIAADGSRDSTSIDINATDNGDDTITLTRQ